MKKAHKLLLGAAGVAALVVAYKRFGGGKAAEKPKPVVVPNNKPISTVGVKAPPKVVVAKQVKVVR